MAIVLEDRRGLATGTCLQYFSSLFHRGICVTEYSVLLLEEHKVRLPSTTSSNVNLNVCDVPCTRSIGSHIDASCGSCKDYVVHHLQR
jgi:hypothetical protein